RYIIIHRARHGEIRAHREDATRRATVTHALTGSADRRAPISARGRRAVAQGHVVWRQQLRSDEGRCRHERRQRQRPRPDCQHRPKPWLSLPPIRRCRARGGAGSAVPAAELTLEFLPYRVDGSSLSVGDVSVIVFHRGTPGEPAWVLVAQVLAR